MQTNCSPPLVSHMVNITNPFFSFLSLDFCWLATSPQREGSRVKLYVFVQQNLAVLCQPSLFTALPPLVFLLDTDSESQTRNKNIWTGSPSYLTFTHISILYEDIDMYVSLCLLLFTLCCMFTFVCVLNNPTIRWLQSRKKT